eukprot:363257-Chlamydomonas_euryale.AAC.5
MLEDLHHMVPCSACTSARRCHPVGLRRCTDSPAAASATGARLLAVAQLGRGGPLPGLIGRDAAQEGVHHVVARPLSRCLRGYDAVSCCEAGCPRLPFVHIRLVNGGG